MPEDLIWLELALDRAIMPVTPRPEFVLRAKEELMHLPVSRPPSAWALLAASLALLSIIVALFYLGQRES